MKKTDYIKESLISGFGVLIYVSAVAWLITSTKSIFGDIPEPNLFIPVFMLLLFIISATVVGLLILGKPIYLYLSGLKKEAIFLLLLTLGWLVLFLVAAAIVLLFQ
ncbi:MAG: hypothetical protein PHV78_01125 [Patescibacteria group bacterium]|nr:hypothetical protein [Patescibacteria group bacterium]MDD5121238.1 hypothetical protein [Patescibacteria group bacterium]MDD5222209.1 hypothetical protein [Patescibacteria group bacterium]MDD5395843.1 hypothetical protein [Patescibacteria group bacterium]